MLFAEDDPDEGVTFDAELDVELAGAVADGADGACAGFDGAVVPAGAVVAGFGADTPAMPEPRPSF
jgi:hypothetical protein